MTTVQMRTLPRGARRPRPQAGRPLDPAVDRRILRAAREVVGEVGLSRTTWARIADRSGAGYPTMMRRWDSVHALVMDALRNLRTEIAVDDRAPAREALEAALREDLDALAADSLRPFVRTMLFAGARDAAIGREVRTGLIGPRRDRYAALIARGVAEGDLRGDIDVDAACAALCDLVVGAVAIRRPSDPASASLALDLLLGGAFAESR